MKYFWRRTIIAFIAVNILALLWVFFSSLPIWQLREIIILGNSYIPQQTIINSCQITRNSSIFKLSTFKISQKLEKLPWIEKVSVSRRLPNKLVIKVKPKSIAYKIPINGRDWFIDRKGNILNREGINLENNRSYIINGLDSIANISKMLENVSPLVEQLSPLVTGNLTINYAPDNINIINNGLLIKIGEPIAYQEKLNALKNMLKVLEPKLNRIEYIDVRAYKTPAVKMRK